MTVTSTLTVWFLRAERPKGEGAKHKMVLLEINIPLDIISANLQPNEVVFRKLLPTTNTGDPPAVYPYVGVMKLTETSGVKRNSNRPSIWFSAVPSATTVT